MGNASVESDNGEFLGKMAGLSELSPQKEANPNDPHPLNMPTDGRWIAMKSSIQASGKTDIWDLTKVIRKQTLPANTDIGEFGCVLSTDGKRLATTSNPKDGVYTVQVWDVATGTISRTLPGLPGQIQQRVSGWQIQQLEFSPDGKRLAIRGSSEGGVRLWDVDEPIKSHAVNMPAEVADMTFSPDGKLFASNDGTARLWEASTGQAAFALAPPGGVHHMTFSPKGSRLASLAVCSANDKISAATINLTAMDGNAASLPQWVEILTGTTLEGDSVRVLTRDEWQERLASLKRIRAGAADALARRPPPLMRRPRRGATPRSRPGASSSGLDPGPSPLQ